MKFKKTLLAGALLTQSIFFCADNGVTPRTQKKRNDLMQLWGPDLVEELTQNDARSAINFLNDLDLDAATPRISDTSDTEIPDILHNPVITEHITVSTQKSSLEHEGRKPFSIAERTPSITIGETDSLEPYKKLLSSPSDSQEKLNPIASMQTPTTASPEISDQQQLIKKKSTTIIALGMCTTVIALAALVYFLKNSIKIAKLS